MARYIIRRILQSIPTIFMLTVLSFTLIHLAPGGPGIFYAKDFLTNQTPEEIARMRQIYGLDRPIPIQYLDWLGDIFKGDLGNSYNQGEPVKLIIARTLPNTFILMLAAILIALVVSIPIGVISATKRYGFLDFFVTFIGFFGISIPTFWIALISILIFAVYIPILPIGGIATPLAPFSLVDRLKHLILPSFVLSLPLIGQWTRYIRSSMLDVLNEDYIRTAYSKGLSKRIVIFRHGLRNALIPMITLLGISLAYMIGGSAVVEYVFSWPGLGQKYLFAAVQNRDFPVLMGALLFTSLLTIAGSLFADIVYSIIDPRIRSSD